MIPFHQYQRYKVAEYLIDSFKRPEEKLNILEVGANEHKNLKHFLPDDKIKYLDVVLSEELLKDPDFIQGDATDLEFPDDSFDLVLALDVLEHIPPLKRDAFLQEIFRVSKYGVVLSAPFLNKVNKKAEEHIAAYYSSIYGEDIVWQVEHRENGLPLLRETLDTIREFSEKEPLIISHGDSLLWEKLMRMEFMTGLFPQTEKYWNQINEYYNTDLINHDFVEEGIRTFLVLPKNREPSTDKMHALDAGKPSLRQLDSFLDQEKSFYELCRTFSESLQRNPHDQIQLFVDTGDGFNEKQSLRYFLYEGGIDKRKKFVFDLSAYDHIQEIRMDPSYAGGMVNIYSSLLVGEDGQQQQLVPVRSNAILNKGNLFLFPDEDPQLIYKLNPEKILRCIFEIEYKDLNEGILFNSLEQSSFLQKQTEHMSRQISSMNNLLESESELLRKLVEQQAVQASQLSEYVEQTKTQNQMLQQSVEEMQEKLSQQESLLFEKEQDLLQLRGELDQYRNSTSWKITAPFRKVMTSLKKK